MRIPRKTTLLFILLVYLLSSSFSARGLLSTADPPPGHSISVTITDAWYEDADGDSYQDDVVIVLDFAVQGNSYNQIIYLLTLVLPSGTSYSYLIIIVTSRTQFRTTNILWDHATESGWYTVNVDVQLNGYMSLMDSDTMTFDPPGGDNADPSGVGVYLD